MVIPREMLAYAYPSVWRSSDTPLSFASSKGGMVQISVSVRAQPSALMGAKVRLLVSGMQLHSKVNTDDTINRVSSANELFLCDIVIRRTFLFSILSTRSSTICRFFLLLFLLGTIKASYAILIKQVYTLRFLIIAIFE